MVRSGGRAQVSELWIEARFRADLLPASSSAEPNRSARSINRFWSESQALESRSFSKERWREGPEESESSRNASRRPSIWSDWETLGFKQQWEWRRTGSLAHTHGRFAIDGASSSVSIASGGEREREREWAPKREGGGGEWWLYSEKDRVVRTIYWDDTCVARGDQACEGSPAVLSLNRWCQGTTNHFCLFIYLLRFSVP